MLILVLKYVLSYIFLGLHATILIYSLEMLDDKYSYYLLCRFPFVEL